jgi:ankyrin repeat protein
MKKILVAIMIIAPACAMENVRLSQKELNNQLIAAASKFDTQEARRLLAQGASINARDDNHQATALHFAIGTRDYSGGARSLAMIRFLLSHPEIDVNAINNQGTTPLIFALYSRRFDIAELLFTRPELNVHYANHAGDTALAYARTLKKDAVKEFILQRDDGGRTAEFMENGSEPYRELVALLATSSHAAALRLAQRILEERQPFIGWSVYFLAIALGNIEVVRLLMDAGIQFDHHY